MKKIKSIIRKILPRYIVKFLCKIIANKEVFLWKRNGRPVPPPHRVKQLIIEYYQKKYNINILVETGTCFGDMVYAQLNNFKKIYSIELGDELWANAVKRFRNDKHVKIIHGDSGFIMKKLILDINERAIFWLDGHYSAGVTAKGNKESPILEELASIFTSKLNHILLIDDARCFNGEGDYPTIEELTNYIKINRKESKIEIKDDCIIVVLK